MVIWSTSKRNGPAKINNDDPDPKRRKVVKTNLRLKQLSNVLTGTYTEDNDKHSQHHKTGSNASKTSHKTDEDSEESNDSLEEEDNNELKNKHSEKILVSLYVIYCNINCLLTFIPFIGFSQPK